MIQRDGNRITVPYKHHFANTTAIYIGLDKPGGMMRWVAAFRDMDGDQPIVWAEFPDTPATAAVWIRDDRGERQVGVIR